MPKLPAALWIALLALATRLGASLWTGAEPVWDGHYYHLGAERIAQGLGYSDDIPGPSGPVWHPWAHYPVGYSGALAGFYALARQFESLVPLRIPLPHVALAANAIFGALTAVCVLVAGRSFLSEFRARLAALWAAASPGLALYSTALMSENLSAFGLALALALGSVLRAKRAPAAVVVAISGLLFGACALARPQALLMAPLVAILAWPERRIFAAVLASTFALLPVAPWTARNCRVMDGCALISTNGGWNLAIGSFPRATGRFETLRGSDGCDVVTGQVQQDRCWAERGVHWIAGDPLRWLRLIPVKLSHTFDHESFAAAYIAEKKPELLPPERKTQLATITTGLHAAGLVAAVLGLVRNPSTARPRMRASDAVLFLALAGLILLQTGQTPPHAWPLAVLLSCVWFLPRSFGYEFEVRWVSGLMFTLVVTHAIFFGEDRYHMVIAPFYGLLAAGLWRSPTVTNAEAHP